MRHRRRHRSFDPFVVALAVLVALFILIVAVAEVLAGHAFGPADARDWRGELQKVDAALTRADVAAARLAWVDAYGAALRSRHWEGLVAVADSYRRIGDAGGFRREAAAKARETYLAAFIRARAEGSLDGVLRAADGFADLGDWEVVERVLRVADALAGRDPKARERVREVGQRWSARSLGVERSRPDGH